MRFWIRLLSSGSVTSVQSSDLVLDDLDDECFLESCPLDERDEGILLESRSLSESEGGSIVTRGRLGSLGDVEGDMAGVVDIAAACWRDVVSCKTVGSCSGMPLTVSWEDAASGETRDSRIYLILEGRTSSRA